MHRLLGLFLLAAGIALGAAPAEANPHVWIVAKSEVMYAPDGSITGMRHAWTFDEMFTTYALQELKIPPTGKKAPKVTLEVSPEKALADPTVLRNGHKRSGR